MPMEYTWAESNAALSLAILTSVTGLGLSLYNIVKHATHYNYPRTQKYIFRILFVVPVFAISSVISVAWPSAAVVVLTIRDVYEAFVVYSFLTLILEYAGGDYNCIEQIKHLPPLRHPPPLCCLPRIRRDAKFLRLCKQGTLQFVVIKPTMAAISLIALAAGSYFSPAYQAFMLIIYNGSYSTALYCLFLMYLATSSLLTQYNAVLKFLAVKSIIFLTFWQSVVLYFIPGLTARQSLLWNNFILCVEMVPFALLLNHAFPYHEFMTSDGGKRVVDSVREMLGAGDIIQDAYHSFMPSYQDYVVARDDHDAPAKTIRTKTFLVGNLDRSSMEGPEGAGQGSRATGGTIRGTPPPNEDAGDFGVDDAWSADVDVIEVDLGSSKKGGTTKSYNI